MLNEFFKPWPPPPALPADRSANEVRADSAMVAVSAHSKLSADHYDNPVEQFTDLMINLVHLAQRLGVDFETQARLAALLAADEVTPADPAASRQGRGA